MKLKNYFLIISLLLANFSFAQENTTSVIVELHAGAKIPGNIAQGTNFNNIERLDILDLDKQKKSIPLKAIKTVKTTSGETLFPVPKNSFDKIELKAGAIIQGELSNKSYDFSTLERLKFVDAQGEPRDIPLVAIKTITDAQGSILYPKASQQTTQTKPQNYQVSQYDKIILKAGAEILVDLKLGGQNPSTLDKIPFEDNEKNQRSIPLIAIAKIVDKYGVTIYPAVNSAPPKPLEVKEKCNSEDLKQQMTAYMVKRYDDIVESIEEQTQKYTPASYALESEIIDKVHKVIAKDVESLKTQATALDAKIKIYVNKNGKVDKIEEEIFSSKQLRNFTRLKEEKIYPYLKSLEYPTQEKSFEFENEYENFYNKYKFKIEDHPCPATEFDDILKQAKEKFGGLKKKNKKTGTFYIVPIKYSFVKREQKWTYYNNILRVQVERDFIKITNPETKRQFNEVFTKKQKNGKYKVNATYYTALSDSIKVHINSVKRKYKYVTHFGVSTFAHFQVSNIKLALLPDINAAHLPLNFNHFDVFTFNAHAIFHRIGFFGGIMRNFDKRTTRTEGIYLNENSPTYFEGGLYVGIAPYVYLKGGYSYLQADIQEYDDETLMVSKKNQNSHGLTGGLALMFPFVSVEVGYNTNLSSLYAGMGLHVTLNK